MEKDICKKIKEAGALYAPEGREAFAGSEMGKIITKEIPKYLKEKAHINEDKFLVVGSIGKGQFAEIPWISIFDKNITQSATKGIYIVYLYTADMKGIYLSLNQGYTYFKDRFGGRKAKPEIRAMATEIRKIISISENIDIDKIELKSSNSLGAGYMAGHIAGKYYDLDNMPDENEFLLDLLELFELYKSISLQIGNRTTEKFYDYIIAKKQGLIYSEKEINPILKYIEDHTYIQDDEPKDKQYPVIDQSGTAKYLRDPKVTAEALNRANFKCEFNNDHKTFITKVSGESYMESHHLIPINQSNLFGYSIDIPANVCSLCPNCHRAIYLATDEVKKEILLKLYEQRKDRLEKSGINISAEQLMGFYGIK